MALAGVPSSYIPGQIYQIVVSLSRGEMRRGGFEISARFASGKQKGLQAGFWRALDSRVQIVPSDKDPSLCFAQHTGAGSVATAPGTISWTIEWTAPADAPLPVAFHTAANATNDDASPLGDFIYLLMRRSNPAKKHNQVRAPAQGAPSTAAQAPTGNC